MAVMALPLQAQGPPSPDNLPEPTAVIRYGAGEFDYGELRLPEGEGPFPVAVTIHGGCFLAELGQGSLLAAAAALPEAGIASWDINYRRLGHEGGGWPGTFQDVGKGVDFLGVVAESHPLDLDRVVLVGHSSGAPLAVWAAGRSSLPREAAIRGDSPMEVRAAVGIDGPMDLEAWRAAGVGSQVCGRPVVDELMGGSREAQPDRYRLASPVELSDIPAPVFLNPSGMLFAFGTDQVDMQSRLAAPSVTVVPVRDSDHFMLITPTEEAWATVLETIRSALGLAP